jgi:N-acetylmuramoyl-L-alanine amidase
VERIVQNSSPALKAPAALSPLPTRGSLPRAAIFALTLMLALGPATPGAAGEVRTLRVIANGMVVSLAGNVVIQDSVIMAPYQGLFEPLGISATWDPRDRILSLVSPARDEMQLRAGDPYATVNGERRPIPIPLVAVFDKVLIPVQWVFETLGDTTAYNPGRQTLVISAQITGVSWRGNEAGLELTIDGTGPLHPVASMLHGPERLVLDIPGAVPKTAEQFFDVHEGALAAIRISRSPSGTRIVFDLVSAVQYRVTSQIPGRRVLIALGSATAPAGGPPGRPSGYQPSAQKITNIVYEHVDGGGRVVVVANHPLQTTQRTLHHPDRVVIDVADAVFLPVKKSLDVDDGLVVQVRAAQFHSNPNIVRIVIELARPSDFAVRPGPEAGQLSVDLGAAMAGGPAPSSGSHAPVVVALDAGHGGSDPGAIGPTGIREKDVTLAVAQYLRRLLGQQHIDVVMVRDADVFVPLEDRAQIAARGGATLLVSIHANAATDAGASGTQTFYATPPSQPLAAAVLDEVSRATGFAPRGVSQARFKVLVDADRIPAVLLETAFITNPREEQMLRDPAVQQALAQGTLKAIERFLVMPQAAAP